MGTGPGNMFSVAIAMKSMWNLEKARRAVWILEWNLVAKDLWAFGFINSSSDYNEELISAWNFVVIVLLKGCAKPAEEVGK